MSSSRILLTLLFFGLFAGTASTAFAEETRGPLKEELDEYWSAERDLRVLEGKLFGQAGRFGVGLYTGLMSSEPYWWYIPVGGRLSYHFSDTIGVELAGQYTGAGGVLTHNTDLHDFLEGNLGGGFDSTTDLEDRFLWRTNALFVWTPFYGKWSFSNTKLTHLDVNFVAGGGVTGVERPDEGRTSASNVVVPELVSGLGIQFLFDENWSMRADGRVYLQEGATTESNADSGFMGRINVPIEFLLGASYTF